MPSSLSQQRHLGRDTSRALLLPLLTGVIVLALVSSQIIQNGRNIEAVTTAMKRQIDFADSLVGHDTAIVSASQGKNTSPFSSTNPADIHIVSLTISGDFFVLFNNSAIESWARFIKNVKTITFIGPPKDEDLFWQNMAVHYPQFPTGSMDTNLGDRDISLPSVYWVNETYWTEKYMKPYQDKKQMPCPYWKVCQQLIKLHVFELDHLYTGENVLIVDSDTVWSRSVTFINETDGKVTYHGVDSGGCTGMDPIKFTEAITAGPSPTNSSQRAELTHTPYLQCKQTPESGHGLRVGHHHILFQRDVMDKLHLTIRQAWNESSLWRASNTCFKHDYCGGRVAEYLLYYAFLENKYPDRIKMIPLKPGRDVMDSGVCDKEDMKCCEQKGVLLKGCHDHRVSAFISSNGTVKGDMCCQ